MEVTKTQHTNICRKKRKKEKNRDKEIDSCKEKQNEIDTEEFHNSKKKKKKRDKSNRGNEEKVQMENIVEEESQSDGNKDSDGKIPVRKLKKKKRRRETENEESESSAKSETEVHENGKCGSVKKKRKQASESLTDTEKKDIKCDGKLENNLTKKPKKKKRAKLDGTQCVGNSTEESTDLEKEIKKCKENPENSVLNGDHEDDGSSVHSEKRKKKKKHKRGTEGEINQSVISEDGRPLTDSASSHKIKKKKKNKRSNEDMADEPSSKRSKDDQTRESTNGAGSQGPDPAFSGQWTTASLGDEQRQNKFLRLLGGFKAAKSGNSPLLTLEKKGGNVAMTQNQEGVYMRNMEDQYSKAMSFNKSRGLGLGFEKPPSEGKKFYIDKTVSKSKKFDD